MNAELDRFSVALKSFIKTFPNTSMEYSQVHSVRHRQHRFIILAEEARRLAEVES